MALEGIMSRCSNLQHLNLSWTGGGGQVTEAAFCRCQFSTMSILLNMI